MIGGKNSMIVQIPCLVGTYIQGVYEKVTVKTFDVK